jgi:acid phosphatase (class A)
MVPEKRSGLFERARQYGQSRLIVGAHFPSDIEAGRALAAVSAAQMQQNAAFRRDFEAARIELRAVLGLPRDPPDLRPQRPEPPPAVPAPGAR